jgi:MFS family permease
VTGSVDGGDSTGVIPPVSPHAARRVAVASAIGTTIEWYDFFIYGTAAATVFGPRFFPQVSPIVGTLASFATFGVGFIARPLGGIVMGHFGDLLRSLGRCVRAVVGPHRPSSDHAVGQRRAHRVVSGLLSVARYALDSAHLGRTVRRARDRGYPCWD